MCKFIIIFAESTGLFRAFFKMVSIIIPIYNAEAYIGDTLRSVLASTYTNIEVVCMDDGSTDGSHHIVAEFAASDSRIRLLHQANAGVCRARNAAIGQARGELILPVDADNLIEPTFVERAVAAIEADPEVKVVAPRADFFEGRTGEWVLPPFTLNKLAHKNIMDTCALYRKSDWQRIGGYCEDIIAREDWEFWISMLKDGGKVMRLPNIELHYRIHRGSKRETDRQLKRHVIKVLNHRHPEFFEQELGGPLRYRRTWSKLINSIYRLFHPLRLHTTRNYAHWKLFTATLPYRFKHTDTGRVIYRGRNELREFNHEGQCVVVKEFCRPNLINRLAYGLLRKSKAQRSCEYAALLRQAGIGSPEPVSWCTVRNGLLLDKSYYVSVRSQLPYTYIDLMEGRIEHPDELLREVGRTAARMHQAGMIHRDFSRGNLLMGYVDGKPYIEVVDLNRIRFRQVSLAEGIENLQRLPATDNMKRLMAEGYAEITGADPEALLVLWPQTEAMDSKAAGVRS